MTWWEAGILGLVQGLTEFLPVSSDGHLDLAKALLGLPRAGVVFDVVLHVATLCAVVVVYWRRLTDLLRGAVRGDGAAWRYLGLIALATVPAGAAGLLWEDFWAGEFSLVSIGVQFLVTGGILWSTQFVGAPVPGAALGARHAGLIGVAQAAALFPAVSRSGTTVATGMWMGIDPVRAGEFSFLMSLPAIAGAAVLELPKLSSGAAGAGPLALAAGFAVSLVSGVFAIRWLLVLLRRRAFHRFALYCWAVSLVTIGWALAA
jgi:undecaprenyl-diphosphatase